MGLACGTRRVLKATAGEEEVNFPELSVDGTVNRVGDGGEGTGKGGVEVGCW